MYRALIVQLDKNSCHLGLYNYELNMIFEEISKSSLCFIEKKICLFWRTLYIKPIVGFKNNLSYNEKWRGRERIILNQNYAKKNKK